MRRETLACAVESKAVAMIQDKPPKRSSLGRGLSALLPAAAAIRPEESSQPKTHSRAQVLQIAIEDIDRDEHQPRRMFDAKNLESLAASIRAEGIVQPILVRRENNRFRIIAGERRWRAAQLAGLREVPAIERVASEMESFELALIENLQREDLNPIEEAEAYRRLIEEHELTQEAVAIRVGKDRSSVANALRLLHLPHEIKVALMEGTLNMGHARALLGLADDGAIRRAANEVMSDHLSVRATEKLVRGLKAEAEGAPRSTTGGEVNVQVRAVAERLQRALGTRVRLVDHGGKGRIEIEFYSYDDLDRLLARLDPKP